MNLTTAPFIMLTIALLFSLSISSNAQFRISGGPVLNKSSGNNSLETWGFNGQVEFHPAEKTFAFLLRAGFFKYDITPEDGQLQTIGTIQNLETVAGTKFLLKDATKKINNFDIYVEANLGLTHNKSALSRIVFGNQLPEEVVEESLFRVGSRVGVTYSIIQLLGIEIFGGAHIPVSKEGGHKLIAEYGASLYLSF